MYNIKIVNISLGIKNFNRNSIKDSLIYNEIRELRKKGLIILTSAGNYGFSDNSILLPADSEDVITVGSIKSNFTYSLSDDLVTNFTSRNSSNSNKKKASPDIYTLGVDIVTHLINNEITTNSGTSYSTAIITGITILLIEKHPKYNKELVEEFMIDNSYKLKLPDETYINVLSIKPIR